MIVVLQGYRLTDTQQMPQLVDERARHRLPPPSQVASSVCLKIILAEICSVATAKRDRVAWNKHGVAEQQPGRFTSPNADREGIGATVAGATVGHVIHVSVHSAVVPGA